MYVINGHNRDYDDMSDSLDLTGNNWLIDNSHVSPKFIAQKLFQSNRKEHILSFVLDVRLEFNEEARKICGFKGTAYTVF